MTANPIIDVIAERRIAPPVPSPARRSAGKRLGSVSNSSRNRTVKWVEKSMPTPTAIAAMVAVMTLMV